jgi:hypothetical protein
MHFLHRTIFKKLQLYNNGLYVKKLTFLMSDLCCNTDTTGKYNSKFYKNKLYKEHYLVIPKNYDKHIPIIDNKYSISDQTIIKTYFEDLINSKLQLDHTNYGVINCDYCSHNNYTLHGTWKCNRHLNIDVCPDCCISKQYNNDVITFDNVDKFDTLWCCSLCMENNLMIEGIWKHNIALDIKMCPTCVDTKFNNNETYKFKDVDYINNFGSLFDWMPLIVESQNYYLLFNINKESKKYHHVALAQYGEYYNHNQNIETTVGRLNKIILNESDDYPPISQIIDQENYSYYNM